MIKLTEELSIDSVKQFIGEKQPESPCSSQLMSQINPVDAQAWAAVNMQNNQFDPEPVNDETTPPNSVEKRIGGLLTNATSLNSIASEDLSSSSQTVRMAIQSEIGSRQVTVSSLEFTLNG